MRVTLRSVTHHGHWRWVDGLLTACGRTLVIPKCQKYAGSFWCRNEKTTIFVDYDAPVDCMTCLVLEARGG